MNVLLTRREAEVAAYISTWRNDGLHVSKPVPTSPWSPVRGARRHIVIAGAAGRDFHNFNVVYRDDPLVEVIAFTAAQIPDIAGRRYPPYWRVGFIRIELRSSTNRSSRHYAACILSTKWCSPTAT